MISYEEVLLLEQTIRHQSPQNIQDIGALKNALYDGLTDFEELLQPLSSHYRDAVQSLFLERVRETAVQFHLAVLKLTAKNELRGNPTREKARELMDRCEEDMQRIARLYHLL